MTDARAQLRARLLEYAEWFQRMGYRARANDLREAVSLLGEPETPATVLDLLLQLVQEGKRSAALRVLSRHMASHPDDGKTLVQSKSAESPVSGGTEK